MKKIKVALVGSRNFPAQHGGLEIVVESIANRFAERQLAVHVFVGSADEERVKQIDMGNKGSFHVHLTKAVKGKYWHTASQVITGLAEVRRLKPDIVNIHGVGPAFPLAVSRRAFGNVPTLVTAHGLDWERTKWPPFARWLFRKVAVRALKNATSVSCVSHSVGADLSELLGANVVTTLNGFDPIEVAAESGLDLPQRYTVTMSRLTPEKNVEQIVEAYDDEVSSIWGPLVVLGGGGSSYSGDYEAKLRESAAGREIIFLGEVEREVALSIVSGASLFMSMSKLEAQPMAVIEAMSLGVPLVLSDIAPHRELCQESARYASLYADDSLRGILLEQEPESQIRGRVRHALELVGSMTWDRSTDTYVEWYESFVARG